MQPASPVPTRRVESGRAAQPVVVALVATAGLDDACPRVRAVLDAVAAQTVPPAAVQTIPFLAGPSDQLDLDVEWLWLLEPGAEPAPEALAELLAAVERAPSVAIAGCKRLRAAPDGGGQLLHDVGLRASRSGRPVTGLEPNEADQGQHDGQADVCGVGPSGTLIRREVWAQLGGIDPRLTGRRAGLDLGRRAHLAGHRVVVVPTAKLTLDRPAADADVAGGRFEQLWARAVAARPWWLVATVLFAVLACWVRALARLITAGPAGARVELAAGWEMLRRLGELRRTRRRAAAAQVLPHTVLRQLRAEAGEVRRQRLERWSRLALGGRPGLDRAGPDRAGPDRAGPDRAGPDHSGRRRPAGALLSLAVAVAAVAGVAAQRSLLTWPGTAAGPELPPVPQRAGELWQAATSGWRPIGLGWPSPADPLAGLLAVLSLPFGGSPALLVDALLLAAVPLAVLAGFVAAGAVTRAPVGRVAAGLVWAGAPWFTGAVSAGRLGPILAHLILPVAALLLAAVARAPASTASALAVASAAGIAVTALAASAGVLAVPLLVAILGCALLADGRARWRVAWVLAVPAVLLAHWWRAVVDHPALLLGAPAAGAPSADRPTDWWTGLAAATGGPVGRGLLTGAVLAGAVGLAVAWRSGGPPVPRRGLALLWLVGSVALALDGPAVGRGGPGSSLLLLAALPGALLVTGHLTRALRRVARRSRVAPLARGLLAAGTAAGLALPVAAVAGWAWAGWTATEPVLTRVPPITLPAAAALAAESPAAPRTLVLQVDGAGRARWAIARSGRLELGDDSAAREAAARRQGAGGEAGVLATAVQDVLSGDPARAGAVAAQLRVLGVGFIQLLAPFDPDATVSLDTMPGLARAGSADGWVLWRTAAPAAAARVLDPDGHQVAVLTAQPGGAAGRLPAGPAGRVLVLADRADEGWAATIDGRELRPVTWAGAGWAQAFAVPAEGGRIAVQHRSAGEPGISRAQWTVAGLAALLLLCWPRRRQRIVEPALPVPRPAGPQQRHPDRPRPARASNDQIGDPQAVDRWLASAADRGEPVR